MTAPTSPPMARYEGVTLTMQSPPAGQLSHLHSRSYRSQPLITNTTSTASSSPLTSEFCSPSPSNTSTLYSDDLPEHKATESRQRDHPADTQYTSSLHPSQLQEPLSASKIPQCGPPRKRRKTSLHRSSSLDRGSHIYRHWTTKSFKPSLAINLRTSPLHIQSLWRLVMMGGAGSGRTAGGTNQGKKKDSKGGSAAEGRKGSKRENTQGSVSGQSYPSSESETTETGTTKTTQRSASNTKSKPPSNVSSKRKTPRSKAFEQNVLRPRSIIIDRHSVPVTAYAHFGAKEPPPSDMTQHQYYTEVRSVPESTIWVEPNTAFIEAVQKTYSDMLRWKMCEAEFATYAKEELLKRNKSLDTNSRIFQTMRLVEFVNKPEPKDPKWVPPPLTTEAPSPSNEFAFDIRPDCSYWVSLQGSNKALRYMIAKIVHTIYNNFASPYFTIEFKKDDQDSEVALNQLAGASALALYNRFCLRQKRFSQKETWTTRRTRVLRHYGLTMEGEQYTVWCTRPTLTNDFAWAGCEMEMIGYGLCSSDEDIRELIYWINEIHCWGLTKHALRVEKDIKWKMGEHHKEKGGSRPSDIGDDSEDEPDTEDEMA